MNNTKTLRWTIKIFLSFAIANTAFAQPVQLVVKTDTTSLTVSRHIYGQFAEHLGRSIYDGFWVDAKMNVPKKDRIRLDVVDALKKIKIPNLRWPGGCFGDEYHWRDGIGVRAKRPKMVNTNWGGVTEDNSFGTHEFLELCNLLNCEPYIAGNVGSGTVEEMAKWVEYLNFDGVSPMASLRTQNGHPAPFKVTYFGVGNESWGCGGNMTPEFYADEFKRYATYARDYPGTPLKKIASGSSDIDYNWTDVLMRKAAKQMWGISLHAYTLPTGDWDKKGSATNFDERQYFNTIRNCLKMDEYITKHSEVMDKYDPKKEKALVIDEWGVWTDVEPGTNPGFLYQQNSMRDALVAATTLNIFNNHCDRVKMANLAQTVNVLQALILTKGNKLLLTPTYHVFDLYKHHQDAKYLPIQISSPDYLFDTAKLPAINVSATKNAKGAVHITMVNLDPKKKISISTSLGSLAFKTVTGQIVTSPKFNDINTFEQSNKIAPAVFNGAKKEGSNVQVELPPLSVVMLEVI